MLLKALGDENRVYDALSALYSLSRLTFKDILNKTGAKKSEISHSFCIPISTIEDWYSGKSKCPSYMLITLLRYFHLFSLGKYVYLECDLKYMASKPSIYEHSDDYEINKARKRRRSLVKDKADVSLPGESMDISSDSSDFKGISSSAEDTGTSGYFSSYAARYLDPSTHLYADFANLDNLFTKDGKGNGSLS